MIPVSWVVLFVISCSTLWYFGVCVVFCGNLLWYSSSILYLKDFCGMLYYVVFCENCYSAFVVFCGNIFIYWVFAIL